MQQKWRETLQGWRSGSAAAAAAAVGARTAAAAGSGLAAAAAAAGGGRQASSRGGRKHAGGSPAGGRTKRHKSSAAASAAAAGAGELPQPPQPPTPPQPPQQQQLLGLRLPDVTSLPQAERELRDLLLKVQKLFDWQEDLFLGMIELRKLPDGHEMREQFLTNYEWAQQWLEQALKGDTQAAGLFDKAVDTLIDDLGQPQPMQPQLQPLQQGLQLPDEELLPRFESALHRVLVKTGASVDRL